MIRRFPAARARRSSPRFGARALAGACVALAASLAPSPAVAQDPPDTLVVPVPAEPDTLAADSLPQDTIFYNLPVPGGAAPPGFATGAWEWEREDILASGANTLAELMADVPGLVALVGGDYGTPAAVSAFGLGAGGVRVFRDGFELYPLEGGVVDLQHVGLAGIQRVRLDRSLGVMTVHLDSFRHRDPRPHSVIEAGTGDLDTNVFRGVFVEPTAFWGSLGIGLERVDTRGLAPEEGGNRTGTWLRYQLHLRDRAGLAFDFRRMGSQTRVPDYAPELARTDVVVRGSAEVVPGVVLEAYTGGSILDADEAGEEYPFLGGARPQHGGRLSLERAGLWGLGELRLFGGDDFPSRTVDLAGGWTRAGVGGVAAHQRLSRWGESSLASAGARGWLGPFLGVTLFGSWESGTFAGRDGPVQDELAIEPPLAPRPLDPPPSPYFTERTGLRAGAALSLLGVELAGAVLHLDVDQHVPLAIEPDLGAPPVAGVARTGLEAVASLPTPLRGLRLVGSYQRWDEDGPYLPQEIYRGSFDFHRLYLDSGNFELWWSLGVRGHDPMSVFVPDPAGGGGLETVPFYQLWYARVQARIVTVRLFLGWENFALRRNLQTFPGRVLPAARTFFGLRWDMWS